MKNLRLEPRNGVIKNINIEIPILDIPLVENPKIDEKLSSIEKDRNVTFEDFISWNTFITGTIVCNKLFTKIQRRF